MKNIEKVLVRHSSKTQNEHAPNNIPWIEYWEKVTQREIPKSCPCCGRCPTKENPMVGAHVEKLILLGEYNSTQYITPTCKRCNDKCKGINLYNSFKVNISDLLDL